MGKQPTTPKGPDTQVFIATIPRILDVHIVFWDNIHTKYYLLDYSDVLLKKKIASRHEFFSLQ